jgi:hypothetical protein
VHSEIELSFGNVLILMLGLAMTWWMSRAPKSFLKLMSTRLPGLDKDRPWLNWMVRWWGRTTFFTLVFGLILMFTPESVEKTPGYSLISMPLALAISFFALRKPKKEDNPYSVTA